MIGVCCDWSGFPAHAGMDPTDQFPGHQRLRLPRTRGDGPAPNTGWPSNACGFPAHAGMDPKQVLMIEADCGFPAHAGMDPMRSSRSDSGHRLPRTPPTTRLPRTRGDGPRMREITELARQASPHTRGWTPELQSRQLASPFTLKRPPSRRSARPGGRGRIRGLGRAGVVRDAVSITSRLHGSGTTFFRRSGNRPAKVTPGTEAAFQSR